MFGRPAELREWTPNPAAIGKTRRDRRDYSSCGFNARLCLRVWFGREKDDQDDCTSLFMEYLTKVFVCGMALLLIVNAFDVLTPFTRQIADHAKSDGVAAVRRFRPKAVERLAVPGINDPTTTSNDAAHASCWTIRIVRR
jgi:hypothetical protein